MFPFHCDRVVLMPGGFSPPCAHPFCRNPANPGFLHCGRSCAKDHEQYDLTGHSSLFVPRGGEWVRLPRGFIAEPPRVRRVGPPGLPVAGAGAGVNGPGHPRVRAVPARPLRVAHGHAPPAAPSPALRGCLRPGCSRFARPGSRFCCHDCSDITSICSHPGCRAVAATSSHYCISHTRMSDIDPRIAAVGGVYHYPRDLLE
jgi:hypothetical protein